MIHPDDSVNANARSSARLFRFGLLAEREALRRLERSAMRSTKRLKRSAVPGRKWSTMITTGMTTATIMNANSSLGRRTRKPSLRRIGQAEASIFRPVGVSDSPWLTSSSLGRRADEPPGSGADKSRLDSHQRTAATVPEYRRWGGGR
jgi:hypothetical protein